ncbi:ABC-F family ATP-binding cassette domain-containing protein [Rhizobium alvei]|uniref:ABC-F family ATP-binding cassette domain-containing protein n=1 Tax=Rhizobium alvei TaxID=1132659 RepID=A0ABT8YHP7_9HYPH|nr:ABC-F family ATP-binding cassette domain-containing protein [Rhizobium alvei]MDO6963183.1 ABC-F family ATP-binding cassette domain-containing protein [Rhizobium alvei]
MPASITVSNVAWVTPDGRSLFSNLNLSFCNERTGLVGRNGVGKTTLLRLLIGELHLSEGAITVEGSIAVLRQSVQTEAGATIADLFGVRTDLDRIALALAGRATSEDLSEIDWTIEARMEAALQKTGLVAEPSTLLSTLSGGQQTRAALSALLFSDPDFLILDEPTNNLDGDGRRAVIDLLAGWKGGALVISHDRDLLETMDAIVEMTSLGATRHSGNYTQFRAAKAQALLAAEQALGDAERKLADLGRQTQMSRERKARRDQAGRAKAGKGDMPKILLGAMKQRSEESAADHARMAERRRQEAEAELLEARSRIEIMQPLAMTLPPTGLPGRRKVLALDSIRAGYGDAPPVLDRISLSITGSERVAVTGPNGSGKSTLLGVITGRIEPISGTVRVEVPHTFFDQSVSLLDRGSTIRDNFLRLNPDAGENDCRAALARFLFRADAALQLVRSLSGGQMLRAALACVLAGPKPPQLLILDEPTNHLDIEALEALEAGLRAYDGALLVVSHDERFLAAIGVDRRIMLGGKG